ncbi:inactive polyglycylase TTLL10 isoform X3 [Eptesicus fuscus]|uniref:inactive polyglycylase TTLL10 isoform X3 n=1 Tax=Eptesicus fuscus TaxID=29078 RepID=UPI002403B373|nr:inactive polyglycylase TTLL10 isoform X3 [Eptesicus fuscus]
MPPGPQHEGHKPQGRARKGVPPGGVGSSGQAPLPRTRSVYQNRCFKGKPPDTRGDPGPRGQPAPAQEVPARQTMCTRAFRSPRRRASRRSVYRIRRHASQTDSPYKEGLTKDRQNADTTLALRGTRPHSHHGNKSQPHGGPQAQDPRKHAAPYRVGLTPGQPRGPRPRAARSRKGLRTVSSRRCPHLTVPAPAAHSHTRCSHGRGHRALSPPTQVSTTRGKPSRIRGVWRSRPRDPGWTHERPMGSSRVDGALSPLSQLDQDADTLEDTGAAKPRATLLERHLPGAEEQPPGTGSGPFFYIGGTNGVAIISSYCKSKGWQRIQDGRREDYKLKWCEVKCRDSYLSFREGSWRGGARGLEQAWERGCPLRPGARGGLGSRGPAAVPRVLPRALSCQASSCCTSSPTTNCSPPRSGFSTPSGSTPGSSAGSAGHRRARRPNLEGTPHALWRSSHGPAQDASSHRETYRLDIRDERETFFGLFDETQTWICKPTASNQGKGIFLLRSQPDLATLQAKVQSLEDDPVYRRMPFRTPQARVVQRYIENPLLLDGKKFDVRSYLLIACAMPYMVFFGHGYARLTLRLYDPHSQDLSGHLTNQFMQKKSPLYMLLKEDTVWSMEQLNRYINDKFSKTRGLPRDWVFTTFTKQMQQIMAHCFLAVKSKLECKLGYFDLIGCDFLIDDNFKVWLLEMNSNPALHTNCEVLKEVIPRVVMETLDLALETFQKSLCSQRMLPLLSQRRFVLLHNGETDVWPRLGLPRHLPRQPTTSGAASPASLLRAADRPGARRPGAPHSAQERARTHALGPDSAQGGEPEAGDTEPPRGDSGDPSPEPSPQPRADSGDPSREPSPQPRAGSGDPSREPSPAPAEEDGEDRKPEDHRGS